MSGNVKIFLYSFHLLTVFILPVKTVLVLYFLGKFVFYFRFSE